jgi:hypothetical protein
MAYRLNEQRVANFLRSRRMKTNLGHIRVGVFPYSFAYPVRVNTRAKIIGGHRLPLQKRLSPIERQLRTNDLNRPAD